MADPRLTPLVLSEGERHTFENWAKRSDIAQGLALRARIALNTATGKVIGHLSTQHRAIDFRDFLNEIDRQTGPGLAIHVICDNLSAQNAPVANPWLLAHPRVQPHFTPTYSS